MLIRVLVAVGVIAAAAFVAFVLRRRTAGSDAPTQGSHHVPTQLDRADFVDPGTPWLVVLFSSATCQVCTSVRAKAEVLRSSQVVVADIEFAARRDLHEKYRIDGVPCLLIADSDGVVQRSFLGPVTATDLWAAVADARDPGARPDQSCEREQPDA